MTGDMAREIKERVPMVEAAAFYGFHPSRHGYICCPFHNEKTGSLKIYSGGKSGWHCFGCGRGGSVIDFVMELFGLTFPQACLRLNTDFHLGLDEEEDPEEARRRRGAARRAREFEERRHRQAEEEYRAVAAERRYYTDVMKYCAPGPADAAAGYIHPLFGEALRHLPELDWWLDEHIGR